MDNFQLGIVAERFHIKATLVASPNHYVFLTKYNAQRVMLSGIVKGAISRVVGIKILILRCTGTLVYWDVKTKIG